MWQISVKKYYSSRTMPLTPTNPRHGTKQRGTVHPRNNRPDLFRANCGRAAFEVVLLEPWQLPNGKGLETLKSKNLDEEAGVPMVVLTVTADEELAAEAVW